jgi:Family of unknown function (DUF6090)
LLLRRLTAHVKAQDWTAVAIEFVIVVIGVFVGIQVANWNEARATARRAAVFDDRLRADLRQESWRYQFLHEYHRDVHAAAQKTADALAGKTTLGNEEFLVNAYRASQYKQGASRRATYDQLISTGSIGLIKDPELLRTATRAYSITTIDNLVREGVESKYRELFRMNVDNDVQRALGKNCGDRYIEPGNFNGMEDVLDYPCKTGLPVAAIDAAAEALRSDPRTLQYLRVRIADLETRLVDMTSNNRDVFEGLQDIAGPRP